MAGQFAHDVLRRMASPPPPAPEDVPITSSRALRLALTRAADKTHEMVVNVLGLREETLPLDGLLPLLDPGVMLVALREDDALVGIAGLDLNLRTALIEAQTIGKVLAQEPEPREPTGTDADMAAPMVNALFFHMSQTTLRTPMEGWGAGVHVAEQIESARAAGLILAELPYRIVRMSIDLTVADRKGELLLALPGRARAQAQTMPSAPKPDWNTQFQSAVNKAPARLEAVLHRFKLPLYVAENLKVGQVLPLPGCTVGSVRLIAPGGVKTMTARLGQSGGMRAVRIERAPGMQMRDLDAMGDAGQLPPSLPMDDGLAGFGGEAPDIDGAMMDMAEPAMADIDMMADDITADTNDVITDEADMTFDGMGDFEPIAEMPQDDTVETAAAPLDWGDEGFENPD